MTGRHAAFRASNRQLLIAASLVASSVVLGGGGSPNPLTELWLQLLAAIAGLAWLWLSPREGGVLPRDRTMWIVAATIVLLPVVQLVPMPPSLWTAMPGREVQLAALELVGEGDSWRPLSLSPPRTLASLLSLFPPLLLLLMTAALPPEKRGWLIAAIAALAVLSTGFGALQLAGGRAALRLYAESHEFVVTGFQANRNSTADVLLIGIVALTATAIARPDQRGRALSGRQGRQGAGLWLAGLGLLLSLGIVLTASRMGIALLPVALFACWVLLRSDPSNKRNGAVPMIAAGVLALALAGIALLRNNTALKSVAERFDILRDGRLDIWTDSWFVLGQYWPVGSGMGTFIPSFVAAEPLEAVDPTLTNRAHNDYLELAIEAGLFGLAALALVAGLLLFVAIRAWRSRPQDRAQLVFGLTALIIVAVHSLVDYPLRSMTLASLAAVAAGMFARPPGERIIGDVRSPAPA